MEVFKCDDSLRQVEASHSLGEVALSLRFELVQLVEKLASWAKLKNQKQVVPLLLWMVIYLSFLQFDMPNAS